MKDETLVPARKARSSFLLAVLFAAVAALSLLTYGETIAQSATPTPTESAGAVPKLTARATTHGVELNWGALPNAVRYELFTWWDLDIGWRPIGGDNLTATSYTHTSAVAGTQYFYSIRAIYAGSEGPWLLSDFPTAVALAMTGDGTATPTPTATEAGTSTPTPTPTASASADTNAVPKLTAQATLHGVELNWEALPNAVRYELLTWWDAAVSWRPIGGDNLTVTSYTHTGAVAGTEYFYSIRAIYVDAEGPWLSSDYPTAVALAATRDGTATPTPIATPAPRTPTPTPTPNATASANAVPKLTAQATTHGVELNWEALPNAVRYELFTWWDAGIGWRSIGGDNLTATAYTHTSAVAGTEYFYSIRAIYAGSEGPWLSSDFPTATALARTGSETPTVTSTPTGFGTPTVTSTPTVAPDVATLERRALIALYEATDGANWKKSDNWLTDMPLDTWYGVSTDGSGNVTEVDLSRNDLNGRLPDLSALTNLMKLNLSYNRVRGNVAGLIRLRNLTDLDLSNNLLQEALPSLSMLGNLTELNLSRNRLFGQIPDLSALTSLRVLDLQYNMFRGSIPQLSALSDLEFIFLRVNDLSGPIPDLSALTELKSLILSDNELSGNIPDLGALSNLLALHLDYNELSGPIPDLSALTELGSLDVFSNALSGPIPDIGNLTGLTRLVLSGNELSGPIPDLSALTELRLLQLSNNELSGPIPDLSALTELRFLYLSDNELSGPIPDLSILTKLEELSLGLNKLSGGIPELGDLTELTYLNLEHNLLTGLIVELGALSNLWSLVLQHNQFTGPIPDLSALSNLRSLSLMSTRLCVPAGADLSGLNESVTVELNRVNLPTCTDAELKLVPGVPGNFSATVDAGQVMLTWDAAANAVSYDLRAWDSLNREWGSIGGVLTDRSFPHAVLTDGRNYYYQVRARHDNGSRGAWSEQLYVAVVEPQFPPPPKSLGLDMLYQKYLDVGGVGVSAPSEISDEKIVQVREIITSMLSNRPDVLETLGANGTRVAIYARYPTANRGIVQLPEFKGQFQFILPTGALLYTPSGWILGVPDRDRRCYVFIHEFSHAIQVALEAQSGGDAFVSKIKALYNAALSSNLWAGEYAATNYEEYWAEVVTYWFEESLPSTLAANYPKLSDYDPEAAKLVEEVFGDATVPEYCKR